MADEMDVQVDRLTNTISSQLTRLTQVIGKEVADIKEAYRALAELIGSKDAGAPKVGTAVAAKAEAPAASGPSTSIGVQLVRVVNGSSEPVLVSVLKDERGAVGGAIVTGFGAAGSFLGNLVGGFLNAATLPWVIAELIVLADHIIHVAPMIERIMSIASEAITKVKDIIDMVPVILDLGIRTVLAYLEPVINFAAAFVKAAATLIGGFLNGLVAFANDLFAKLPAYVSGFITYIVETAVRPAISPLIRDFVRGLADALLSPLYGYGIALGNVFVAAGRYIGNAMIEAGRFIGRLLRETGRFISETALYIITSALSRFGVTPTAPPAPFSVAPPAFGASPDFGSEFERGAAAGAPLARRVVEAFLGPTPTRSGTPDGNKGGVTGLTPPKLELGPLRAPVFQAPIFTAPRDSILPELLERTKVRKPEPPTPPEGELPWAPTLPPRERKPDPVLPRSRSELPRAPAVLPSRDKSGATPSLTLNGGITVNITGARIDGENAQATARAIAESIMQEVQRLAEVERFRRGLPTGSIG